MQLDKSLLVFLKDLKKNNEKPWFEANKPRYQTILELYNEFVEEIAVEMRKSDNIDTVKKFRIYRDVRFSKDKSPYKTNFGTGFSRSSNVLRGGYYLHIQPGESFVGGGFWAPEPQDIKRIRAEFAMDPTTIMDIQKNKTFKKYFGEIKGEGLVNVPKEFDASLKTAELLKKKQWVVMRPFSDEEVLNKNFQKEVISTFAAMRPFFDYMSDVLTTNLNGEPLI
jgi:uncharacterized protein (TIGR02453 family)